MLNYNNSIHKTTNHTPYEVFHSQNKDLYKEVYDYL